MDWTSIKEIKFNLHLVELRLIPPAQDHEELLA